MNIKEQVINIIAECMEREVDSLDCNMDFFDMEGFDSMRGVMILAKLEETFDVMVPEDDIFEITNVNAWVEEIKKLKQ
ncbi:acyl carrier protein [uncultured Butyricimonas sp.]|uniref:acyl carrier protein n=1 Tax=uncultured Butyricimonas sp. TaxID=1268785 RepID=UPI0026DB6DB1|nr:acyl carrier protein [uncultured Butyricimonas sp.]